MNLSPHFTAAEMCRTSQPFRNEPGPVETANLRILCSEVLEKVRAHFGAVTVNSGYRSPAVNKAVGSSSSSQHAKGEAADIEVVGVPNAILAAWIRDNLRFDQLILEGYRPGIAGSGWVHVSFRDGRLRQESLTMRMGSHGPVYSKGINP
jgi:zinc D-Ala-D-Ala carboxypeptidase